jgi:Holliday junction resolvasome RuvABC endonuclease subunit
MTHVGRVLSFDTGAKRMGWSVLDKGPLWVASGIMGLEKSEGQTFQEYRLDLIRYWVNETPTLLETYKPTSVANETIPLIGGGSAAMQSVLAASAITTVQTICFIYGVPVEQIAAVTVKARIGRVKTATKPKVRDGVISLLPELASRKSDWTKADTFDEPDAIGVGLVALGYRAAKD